MVGSSGGACAGVDLSCSACFDQNANISLTVHPVIKHYHIILICFTGTYLFLDADIEATIEYIKVCAEKARSKLRNIPKIREYVAGAIANFTPPHAGDKLNTFCSC